MNGVKCECSGHRGAAGESIRRARASLKGVSVHVTFRQNVDLGWLGLA